MAWPDPRASSTSLSPLKARSSSRSLYAHQLQRCLHRDSKSGIGTKQFASRVAPRRHLSDGADLCQVKENPPGAGMDRKEGGYGSIKISHHGEFEEDWLGSNRIFGHRQTYRLTSRSIFVSLRDFYGVKIASASLQNTLLTYRIAKLYNRLGVLLRLDGGTY